MTALPLPEKSVRLTSAGFKIIYEQIRDDRAASGLVADELEANPRDVLSYLFKLTKRQMKSIDTITDDDLRERTRLLISQLRSSTPGAFEFHPAASRKALRPDLAPGKGPIVVDVDGGSCGVRLVAQPVAKES